MDEQVSQGVCLHPSTIIAPAQLEEHFIACLPQQMATPDNISILGGV